jgi:hypothetical protein
MDEKRMAPKQPPRRKIEDDAEITFGDFRSERMASGDSETWGRWDAVDDWLGASTSHHDESQHIDTDRMILSTKD